MTLQSFSVPFIFIFNSVAHMQRTNKVCHSGEQKTVGRALVEHTADISLMTLLVASWL
jgi:hypothetical protein